jgi:hypothetical protein
LSASVKPIQQVLSMQMVFGHRRPVQFCPQDGDRHRFGFHHIFAKKGVGVHALARYVMELSDVQLYQLSSIRHFVSQTGLLVIFRDI